MYRYYSPAGPAARFGHLCLFVVLLCSGIAGAHAAAALALPASRFEPISLYGHFDILIDDGHALGISDLVAGRGASAFVTSDARSANLGFTQAQVWARFALHYAAAVDRPVVLVLPKPLLDHVTLYSVHDEGAIDTVVTGDAHPHRSRPLDYRGFAFELGPDAGKTVTYYLRIDSPTSAIGLPLALMSADDFQALTATENFFFGCYFGVMASLALCALLLFVLVRDVTFLYYFLYLTAFGLMISALTGYGMQFLWPDAPVAQQLLPLVLAALGVVTGILYVRRFLNLPRLVPAADTVFLLAIVAVVAGVLLHVTRPGQLGLFVVLATALALCPLILVFCLRVLAERDAVARYFLVGWLAYSLGVVATVLDMAAYIPHSTFSANGIYFGSLAEFVALAMALCDRLWRLQRDRESQIAAANADLAEWNGNLEQMVGHRTRELEARNRELSELAIRDSLTGLYNHSTSIELLDQLLQQSQRYGFPVAAIMVDLDHFKQLNDNYGHQAGDKVLEVLSQTLSDSVRGADIVGRYGGEEFLIVMPHADSLAAREYGERLLQRVREIEVAPAVTTTLSASIGISVFHPRGQRASAPELIRRADDALYRSKRDGRDRLTVDNLSLVAIGPQAGGIHPAPV